MYLKITGHLLDVLGEAARGNMREELGIEVTPTYQFLENTPVTLAVVVDETKASQLLDNPNITALQTVEEFNAEIDANYVEKYTLTDSAKLQIDLMLSGKTAANIAGYDTDLPLDHQNNLKALFDANIGGIRKTTKPPYMN